MMNKVLFWDFDGTLIYTNSVWSHAVYKGLQNNIPNCTITFADVRSFMKEGFTWHTPERDFTHLIGGKWWDFMFNKFHLLFKEEAWSTALSHKINYDI